MIEHDAAEFGNHVRLGGWRLGLLVARSVQKDKGHGQGRGANVSAETFKVSAREFADMAGTTAGRVLRYLKAWDAAALDGCVPESALLVPGEELDNFDPENLPAWETFYSWESSRTSPESLDRYTAAAEEEGTTARTTVSVAHNKKAIRAAIKADPAVRLAAREALAEVEIKQARSKARPPAANSDEPLTDLVSLSTTVRATKRNLQDLLSKVIEFKDYPDGRQIVGEYVDELQRYLDAIRQAAMGNSFDAELTRLLEEGVV